MSGDLLRFKTTRSMGSRSFTSSWSLTVEGEELSGSAMSAGPMLDGRHPGDAPRSRTRARRRRATMTSPAVSLEEMARS